jgi:hypothetical protein
LMIVHRIMNASAGNEDMMKSFLGPITSRLGAEVGRPFVDAPIRQDYEVVFEGGELSDEVIGKLERFQNERASLGVGRCGFSSFVTCYEMELTGRLYRISYHYSHMSPLHFSVKLSTTQHTLDHHNL